MYVGICTVLALWCSIILLSKGFILDSDLENVSLFVSPTGSDSNDGRSAGAPFKTISEAVSHLHDHDTNFKNVFIELMSGYHYLEQTVSFRQTDQRRVTIRAYQGHDVHVVGGKQIPTNMFHPFSGHDHTLPPASHGRVMVANLTAAGITNLGELNNYGFYKMLTFLEVFYNGKPLRLARWPNEGDGYVNIAGLVDGKDGTKFHYSGNRPEKWKNEADLWLHGFWYWSWADMAVKVQGIDTASKTITLSRHTRYGLRVGSYQHANNTSVQFRDQGGYFRAINALAELDQPGEYYIDRGNGTLYVWPPSSSGTLKPSDLFYASYLDYCFKFQNSKFITFEGFILEGCKIGGIYGNHMNSVIVKNMEIKNTGGYAVSLISSANCVVTQTIVHDTNGGLFMSGGNLQGLVPSGIVVSHNLIHHFSREVAVGANALYLAGVAGHVHHNEMFYSQYTAIRWSGNDHVVEYNHVHHACMNSSDCGALHTGRSWTGRGNIVRLNHIHHTLRYHPGADVRGIMLDDQYSSVNISRNVFYDNEIHVNIGGGRDNIVEKNIFYNSTQASMQMDARGLTHQHTDYLNKTLHQVPFKSPLWVSRYPLLSTIEENSPDEPMGNQILKNIIYNEAGKLDFKGSHTNRNWFDIKENLYALSADEFNSPEDADFRVRCVLVNITKDLPPPVLAQEVGPQLHLGPKNIAPPDHGVRPTLSHRACPTVTSSGQMPAPKSPYLPDGSLPNNITKTPNEGCWFYVQSCPNHPDLNGHHGDEQSYLHRDVDGEANLGTGTSQTACLRRVPYMVKRCGQNSSFRVIFGPTGAMTLGGYGCFFAQYGCPKHHFNAAGFIHDSYAEHTNNATVDEGECLKRAHAQWVYCGSDPSKPYTSIFAPTGNIRTAGAGCWIFTDQCSTDHTKSGMTYDAWGALFQRTDENESSCLSRAEVVWHECGGDSNIPVTAYFRPLATSNTFPMP